MKARLSSSGGKSMNLINLAHYEALVHTKLTETAWDFYASGAEDERTIAANCQVFGRLKLRPRMLVDVRMRTLATEVLGQPLALPVILGPTTYQRLTNPDAEIASARAATAAGTILVVPTEGATPCAKSLPVRRGRCGFSATLSATASRSRAYSTALSRSAAAL